MTSTRVFVECPTLWTSVHSIAALLASQKTAMPSRAPRLRTAASKDSRRSRVAGPVAAAAVGWTVGLLVVVIGAKSTHSIIPVL
ncbi:hypothetical protein GCM10010302_70420 [Streptomyces polychromogenes]|uniref:Uncharacterized protein n=1 Tax=Streptomyces polychromogenes TaxID=67342 RepID=A0ABP3FPL8_9ACTN